MRKSWVLSFPEGVSASAEGDGELVLDTPGSRLVLRKMPAPVLDSLLRLVAPGAPLGCLPAWLESGQATVALACFFFHVQRLLERGLMHITACADSHRLATLIPTGPHFTLAWNEASDRPCVLSRFAFLCRSGANSILESPLSAARIVLHDHRAAALTCALMTPTTISDIRRHVPDLSGEAAAELVSLFLAAGMLVEMGKHGTSQEEENVSLLSWEFHDLLFHARSREGRHDGPVGNTYRFLGQMEPLPAVKPAAGTKSIELYRPDLERIMKNDPPLARVMEQRCSIRAYAVEPMTVEQLGEFLYRTARVRERWQEEIDTPRGMVHIELTSRPYPSGGTLYPLEIYPVVGACRDLAPGLYHYCPDRHRLEFLSGKTPEVVQLLGHAGMAAGMLGEAVQVLLIFTARFKRLAYKYERLAYSLILKEAGVLMQNMYLAATAMDLAPCALGTGDSDLFVRAVRGDYTDETSIGEFLLGSTH